VLALRQHGATPEQLPIISGTRLGVEVIRGAAGSGKTSTALLRLEALAHTFVARRRRLGIDAPVKILVLTFNRTLAGYIEHLAESQVDKTIGVRCEVKTFAAWAHEALRCPTIINKVVSESLIQSYSKSIPLAPEFLLSEIDYIRGRFQASSRSIYLTAERTGRGSLPVVPRLIRPAILQAIENYELALARRGEVDWNTIAELMISLPPIGYDIVIVDEAQDFSANQLRAVNRHLASTFCLTLVLDTMQRLYPRGFSWSETGISMQSAVYHRLRENHRNTVEIAAFARGIIDGVAVDDDGTLPDFSAAKRHGDRPIVCIGRYQQQVDFALNWIQQNVNLANETVAFLKPLGGRWFETLKESLRARRMRFVEITRDRDWPEGPENIALSTMHSAKGIEFDHVIILGLSDEVAHLPDDISDDAAVTMRRLIAMAAGRARSSLLIGYKPGEQSRIVNHFASGSYREVAL